MDWMTARQKGTVWIKEYRYVILVLAAGLVLMLIPEKKGNTQQPTEPVSQEIVLPGLQEELTALLQKMEGVGQVSVLLTKSRGEQVLYQTDTDISSGDSRRSETVILSGSGRDQQGLVTQVIPPTYLGAVVVCQGASNPAVRLAVVEAVSKATGLSTEKIVVVKMK